MTAYDSMLTQAITWSTSIPVPGIDTLRLAVRVAVPTAGTMVIGSGVIGSATIGTLAWVDLTADVEGLSFVVGGEPGSVDSAVEAGELTMTVRNGARLYSAHVNEWYGPGTVIQVTIGNQAGTIVQSQYVGVVTEWNEHTAVIDADSYIEINAIEPFGMLAQINQPAVAAVGAGDTPASRKSRLATAAGWQFGSSNTFTDPGYTCAATTMADNRMTELRKLAQSFNAQVFSNKLGRLSLYSRGETSVDWDAYWFTTAPLYDNGITTYPKVRLTPRPTGSATDGTVPYVSGSLITTNDDKQLISDVTLKQADGAASVTYSQEFGSRYQPRSLLLDDLTMTDAYGDADLAWLADKIMSRSDETYRPTQIDVTTLHGAAVTRFLLAANIVQFIPVVETERLITTAPVSPGAISMTSLLSSGSSAPGAASQATASISVTAGDTIVVYVNSIKAASTDPNWCTCTGPGGTYAEVTAAQNAWTSTGTTRRRSQVFTCNVTSTTSGAITFSGLNTPDTLDWQVVKVTNAHTTVPYVVSATKIASGTSLVANTLLEPITMGAAASSNNRTLGFFTVNANSVTTRMELNTDTSPTGEASYTTLGTFGSASTRARKSTAAWLNAAPSTDTDLKPGIFGSDSATYGETVLEIAQADSVAGSVVSEVEFWNPSICKIEHYIRPLGETSFVWDATLYFDNETVSYTVVNS